MTNPPTSVGCPQASQRTIVPSDRVPTQQRSPAVRFALGLAPWSGFGFGERRDGRPLRRDGRGDSHGARGGSPDASSASAGGQNLREERPFARHYFFREHGRGRGEGQVQLAGEGGRRAAVRRVGRGRDPTAVRVLREDGGGLGTDGTRIAATAVPIEARPRPRRGGHPALGRSRRAGGQTKRPVLEAGVVPRPSARWHPHGVPRRRDPPKVRVVRGHDRRLGRRGASASFARKFANRRERSKTKLKSRAARIQT